MVDPRSPALRVLDAAQVDAALDIPGLLGPIRAAFIALSDGSAHVPVRGVVEAERGTTLLMGAHVPGLGLAGKVVSVFPENAAQDMPTTRGLVVLLDRETGTPLAVCDGGRVTAWRTGAASAVATDALAVPDATCCAIIGAGAQAETQLLAMEAVRPLTEIRVFARNRDGLEAFVHRMDGRVRARVVAAPDARRAVTDAQIICTATTSSVPVFPGDALAPGAHINAVGAFKPDMREVDGPCVGRARVFIDHRPAALAEAGDLLAAEREGLTHRDAWIELGAVLSGRAPGRQSPDDITLFESVGNASQDVAAGALLLTRTDP